MIAQNLQWIKEGYYVDAKDKHGDWQVGYVLSVTKVHIKIRFDGWASKNDQLYLLNTQRIKPFRSITKGYTGQKKYPGVRQHWNFNLQNHQTRLEKFQDFVGHISEKSGFQINQYLRGENYFYIDYLLTLTYPSMQAIIKVYAYFKAYFEFIKSYFQQFIQRDSNLWFQAGQKQQLSAKKVYSDLHYQLFQSINHIIGSAPRSTYFIKNNQKLIKQMIGAQGNYQNYITKQLANNQFFLKFEGLINKIYQQTSIGIKNVPFAFLTSIFNLFYGLQKLPLTIQLKKKIISNFIYIIEEYLKLITVQDAKINEKYIEQLLCTLRIVANKLTLQKQDICRWVEKARLKLWIYLIQCDVLQKKLRGINKIKDFYDLIVKKLNNPNENSTVLFSKAQFKAWMDDQQLLKIIFQTNQHSQVIKKGSQMVQFFYACQFQLCTIEDIVYIWQTCFKKHEAIKKIIFGFWNDLAEYIKGQNDWKEFVSVLLKNQQHITEEWQIQSLITFLHSIRSDDQNQAIQNVIQMMYRKTLQNQRFIPQFAKQLSFFDGDSLILRKIIDNCLQMISQKNQPIFHLKLLFKIFNQLLNYKIYLPENIIVVLIEELREFVKTQNNQKFITTVFNLFNEIMSAKDNGASTGNPNGVKLTFQNLQTLWQVFSQTPYLQFRRQFYSWMVPKTMNSTFNNVTYFINSRFSHQFRLQIFSNIMCDQLKLDYKKMDINQFNVFKEFFVYANTKAGIFEVKHYSIGSSGSANKRILRVKSKELQGLKQLWEIFRNCQNQEVGVAISTFLKDMYLRSSASMPHDEKVQRIKSLMQKIRQFINQDQINSSYLIVKRALILISKLLTDIKERVQISKQFQKIPKTQKITITAYISSHSDAQQIQIYTEQPFINVKSIIAQKFHISKDQFTLYNGKTQVQRELYDLPYCFHGFEQNLFKIVKIGNQFGKYIMNFVYQNFYHQIISFLKNQNICTEAFHLLQHLEIHEPVKLHDSLSQYIEQVDEILKNKKKLYLHIYFIRVFTNVIQKDLSQTQGSIIVLRKLISHLQMPIQNSLIVNYLQKLIEILNNFMKKHSQLLNENITGQLATISLPNFRSKIFKLILNLIKYLNHNPHLLSNHQLRLFNVSLMLYMTGFESQKKSFDNFIKQDYFKELMFEIFIKCQILVIKKTIQKKICGWLKEGFYSTNEEIKVAKFFINELYYQIYQQSFKKIINSVEFVGIFKIFRIILQTVSIQTFKQIVYGVTSSFGNQIFGNHILEAIQNQYDTPSSVNFMLNGQLQMFVGIIKRDRSLINPRAIQYFFYECIIYAPGKSKKMQVKCLFKQNITLILEILWYSMVNIESKTIQNNVVKSFLSLDNHMEPILSKFREFHYLDDWRNSRDWNLDFQEISRIKFEFVGLENPGCICYLNSLLQQLYMIEQFRSAILNMNTIRNNQNQEEIDIPVTEDSPQLISKLKLLFFSLMYSQKPSIDPQFFTSSIRTGANRPMVKIFQQMDIDQFSMILFDKIQNKLHQSKTPNFIRELFGGTYSNEIISQQCNHSSERQEQFLSISLDVKKHITQGFQSLVKGQLLQGQNAYFCDGCDKKVKALKRLSIKRLPPHLIISLRRFQFDYEIDQKIKINKYCEFPFELNLQNFSQDKLNELNQKNKKQERTSMSEQQPQKQSKKHFPPQYYVYKLKGVVVHAGSADSGHYYSFIESKDGNWFEFNDQKVSEFDIKHLEEQAFGGKDGQYIRIKNAYLLFYQRKTLVHYDNHAPTQNNQIPQINRTSQQIVMTSTAGNYFQQTLNQSSLKALQQLMSKQRIVELPQNKQIIEGIIMENKKNRVFQFFFSKQYMEFAVGFLKNALYTVYKIQSNQYLRQHLDYHGILNIQINTKSLVASQNVTLNSQFQHQVFKYLITYTFLIQLRQKNFHLTFQLLGAIKKIFFKHSDESKRFKFLEIFLQQIGHQSFIDEFLINCLNRQKSRIIANFVFEAIQSYLLSYTSDFYKIIPRPVYKILKLIVKTIILTNINIHELISILRKIVSMKQICSVKIHPIIQYLLTKDFITVLIDNALGIQTPKQIRLKRIQNLDHQKIEFQQDISQQIQEKSKRKNSDLSAKGDNQEIQKPQPKKHQNQKMQIQGVQDTLSGPRKSVLFGSYFQQTGTPVKTFQKQTWTLLWQILKQIKNQKHTVNKISALLSLLKKKKSIGIIKENNKQDIVQHNNVARNSIEIQENPIIQTQNQITQISNQIQQGSVQPKTVLLNSQQSTQRIEENSPVIQQQQYRVDQQNFPVDQQHDDGTQEQQSQEQISEQDYESSSPESSLDADDIIQINQTLQIVNKAYGEVQQIARNLQCQSNQNNISVNATQIVMDTIRKLNQSQQSNQVNTDPLSNIKEHNSLIESNQKDEVDSNRKDSLQQNLERREKQNQQIMRIQAKSQLQIQQYQKILDYETKIFDSMYSKFNTPLAKLKADKLMKIFSEQKDTKSIISLAAFTCELIYNNNQFNQTVLIAIQTGFKDYESSKYRPFFIMFQKMLEVNDQLAKKRRIQILRILKNSIKCNDKYFIECDLIHQYLLRYASKFPLFQALLRENPSFINELKNWIKLKQTPGSQTIKKHCQANCERHVFRLHGIMISGQMKDYENLSAQKFDCFEKIKQFRFSPTRKYGDESKVGEIYKKGDIIECYFDNALSWVECKVEQVYFGIVLVHINPSSNRTQRTLFFEEDQKIKLKKAVVTNTIKMQVQK